jgi:predicted  nucleic acid-binding Zn-ribbon protein
MDAALLPLLAVLLGGGLITAWVAVRKAPVERDSMRVSQADTVADGALALLEQERERFRESLEQASERHERAISRLGDELKAIRRDRTHDQEQCRQLSTANEALRDEVDSCQRRCRELEREVADLRALHEEGSSRG